MNIYAVYKYNMVTISPNEKGGSDIPAYKFEKGKTWNEVKMNFPAPELDGKTFSHWSLSENGDAIPDTTVFTEDTYVIYAQYIA